MIGNTAPEQSIRVNTALELEAKYPTIVRSCGQVSPYHMKNILNTKNLDVSEGVVAIVVSMDAVLSMLSMDAIHGCYPCILPMDAIHGCYPWIDPGWTPDRP